MKISQLTGVPREVAEKRLDEMSVAAGNQLEAKRREEKLRKFIRNFPVTIRYGCHTIELSSNYSPSYNDGFTFREDATPVNDTKGIHIHIV